MNNSKNLRGLVYLLFIISGFSAPIYEIVWFQMLRLAIGSSSVSLTILLVSFMGGMFLGSLLFGKLFPLDKSKTRKHPLKLYAGLELGIGICGAAMLLAIPLVGQIYSNTHFPGQWSLVFRAAIALLFLLPPTICMGATLPAIARWLDFSPVRMVHLSRCYSANIAGGVVGACFAGFYLLRFFDVTVATTVAVAANLFIAALSYAMARKTEIDFQAAVASSEMAAAPQASKRVSLDGYQKTVLAVACLCGVTSLGSQIVWTRLLSLLFGGTVYTFSMILSVFLIGLGIGSIVGGLESGDRQKAKAGLFRCLFLLVLTIPYAAWAVSTLIPSMTFFETQGSFWLVGVAEDLVKCSIAILPSTILWGACFPLALAAIDDRNHETGKLVGWVYAANTLGCIVGSFVFGLISIRTLGTNGSQFLTLAIACVAVVWLFIADKGLVWNRNPIGKLGFTAAIIAIAVGATQVIPAVNQKLIAFGQSYRFWMDAPIDFKHHAEGLSTSVAIFDHKGHRSVSVGGKVVASAKKKDMRLQRMLGHIPTILHRDPKSVLIVGFGAGVTAGTFAAHPSIERIVIVEIEPEVVRASGKWFCEQNNSIVNDPRVEIIYDDGRHFLATTKEKFDVVTTDPIHPWVKGAAILYSKEFYDLVKLRLNPEGIMTQWVPLYDTNEAAVKSELATFFEVFEHGTLWDSSLDFCGYDLVALGTVEPMKIDPDSMDKKILANAELADEFREVDLHSSSDILNTFSGFREDCAGWLADAELNVDRNLRLQYLAGESVGVQEAEKIYFEIIREAEFTNRFSFDEQLAGDIRKSFETRRVNALEKLAGN